MAGPRPTESAVQRAQAFLAAHPHLLKYVLIGAAATAIDVGLFLALYNLAHVSATAAQTISVPAAVLFSFAANARHNFRTNDRVALRLALFVGVASLGYALGLGVIEAARFLGASANVGKLASVPLVAALQYTLNARITFRKR